METTFFAVSLGGGLFESPGSHLLLASFFCFRPPKTKHISKLQTSIPHSQGWGFFLTRGKPSNLAIDLHQI